MTQPLAEPDTASLLEAAKGAKWTRVVAGTGLLPIAVGIVGRMLDQLSVPTAAGFLALGLACIAGLLPKRLLDEVAPTPNRPNGVGQSLWTELTSRTDGGYAIGAAERLLFVSALLMQVPTLIAAWLAFKLASKWEGWKNVVQVPHELSHIDDDKWFVARHDLSSWLLNRFWLGTLFNILAAMAALYAGFAIADLPW